MPVRAKTLGHLPFTLLCTIMVLGMCRGPQTALAQGIPFPSINGWTIEGELAIPVSEALDRGEGMASNRWQLRSWYFADGLVLHALNGNAEEVLHIRNWSFTDPIDDYDYYTAPGGREDLVLHPEFVSDAMSELTIHLVPYAEQWLLERLMTKPNPAAYSFELGVAEDGAGLVRTTVLEDGEPVFHGEYIFRNGLLESAELKPPANSEWHTITMRSVFEYSSNEQGGLYPKGKVFHWTDADVGHTPQAEYRLNIKNIRWMGAEDSSADAVVQRLTGSLTKVARDHRYDYSRQRSVSFEEEMKVATAQLVKDIQEEQSDRRSSRFERKLWIYGICIGISVIGGVLKAVFGKGN